MKRRSSLALKLSLCILLTATVLPQEGCAKAPPNLTPEASAAFNKTQVRKTLDLLRDAAVDMAAQKPPIITFEERQRVVQYHSSTIKIMLAVDEGWVERVQTGLEELMMNLPPPARNKLAPYAALTSTIIANLPRRTP